MTAMTESGERGATRAGAAAAGASYALELVRLCRPRQWAKNVFVLAPLVFSGQLGQPASLWGAAAALACFCLLSSAVYCLNDVVDAPADREHPRKRRRPVAAGRVSGTAGLALAAALVVAAGATAAGAAPAVLPFAGLYLANGLAYVFVLKHRVIIDVLSIAAGFVLRILAGCAAIGAAPSSWILVCGFSLAMLLGFGKRRLEVGLANPAAYRPALQSYDAAKLNLLLGVTSGMCLVSYMLFTVAPETAELHGTRHLIYTVPFVAYGVFRYLFKVQEGRHDGPVEVLLRDPVFVANGLLWLAACAAILYAPAIPAPWTR